MYQLLLNSPVGMLYLVCLVHTKSEAGNIGGFHLNSEVWISKITSTKRPSELGNSENFILKIQATYRDSVFVQIE